MNFFSKANLNDIFVVAVGVALAGVVVMAFNYVAGFLKPAPAAAK